MAFIDLDSIGKKYDDRWIFRDVSFGLQKGEIVAVTGPSGSGKSTLLRSVNRLDDIDEGDILVDGKDIKQYDPPRLRRTVGMVFQFPAIFPGSVRDNLEYGMRLWGIEETGKETTLQAVEDAGLDHSYMDRDAERLSGGEQQRVCLARSLVIGSRALLLDEPTASLDHEATARIESTLMRLKEKRELAILWVTHDVYQAERVADRIFSLDGNGNGRITPKPVPRKRQQCCRDGGNRHE